MTGKSVILETNELIKEIKIISPYTKDNGAPCSIIIIPVDGLSTAQSHRFWKNLNHAKEELNKTSDYSALNHSEFDDTSRRFAPTGKLAHNGVLHNLAGGGNNAYIDTIAADNLLNVTAKLTRYLNKIGVIKENESKTINQQLGLPSLEEAKEQARNSKSSYLR